MRQDQSQTITTLAVKSVNDFFLVDMIIKVRFKLRKAFFDKPFEFKITILIRSTLSTKSTFFVVSRGKNSVFSQEPLINR